MSSTYAQVGTAVFNFVTAIDISAATPEGEDALVWKDTLNRLPKANELNVYPALVVAPASDEQLTGDTDTDFDTVTYSVYIIYSYAEASFAEALLIDLADIVRTEFRTLRANPELLLSAAFDVAFRGEWGGTVEQGERYYRLDVTVRIHQSLLNP